MQNTTTIVSKNLQMQPLHYNTNAEYRQCLRQFFQMNSTNYPETIQQIPDLDDETLDEMSYDESAASKMMDYILDVTKDSPLFRKIYDLAAAQMLSTDIEIGIAVLLSYDYLQLFYVCFNDFLQNKTGFHETTKSYVMILQKLT